jgi:hypothetical protein
MNSNNPFDLEGDDRFSPEQRKRLDALAPAAVHRITETINELSQQALSATVDLGLCPSMMVAAMAGSRDSELDERGLPVRPISETTTGKPLGVVVVVLAGPMDRADIDHVSQFVTQFQRDMRPAGSVASKLNGLETTKSGPLPTPEEIFEGGDEEDAT